MSKKRILEISLEVNQLLKLDLSPNQLFFLFLLNKKEFSTIKKFLFVHPLSPEEFETLVTRGYITSFANNAVDSSITQKGDFLFTEGNINNKAIVVNPEVTKESFDSFIEEWFNILPDRVTNTAGKMIKSDFNVCKERMMQLLKSDTTITYNEVRIATREVLTNYQIKGFDYAPAAPNLIYKKEDGSSPILSYIQQSRTPNSKGTPQEAFIPEALRKR